MNERLPVMVSNEEQENISRSLLIWLNEYPDKPVNINYEYLYDDQPSMALSVIQGAYKTKQYLRGRYEGSYQFKVIYRLQPSNSNNNRLRADEILDALADWAANRKDFPDIGPGKTVKQIIVNSRSAMFGRYENGDEDHQVLMTLDYISA